MKQYWLVVPISITIDDRAGIIATRFPDNAIPAGAPAAVEEEFNQANPREFVLPLQPAAERFVGREQNVNRNRPARAANPNPARDQYGNPPGTEYGFKMSRETRAEICTAFTSRVLAGEHAQELAAKSPGKQYGVFECVDVFETTTPTVIKKFWTDKGELAVKEERQGE